MKIAQVVIGANFGDEGKGLMTDYFASIDPTATVVVRYNGGSQAGHTVQTPDGRRHVFSHFGSASFLGCPTFLSKYFIVNPMFFCKELEILRSKKVNPLTLVDPEAIVSTPFDVFINQLVERRRNSNRHGSCGLGINETVTRCLRDRAFRTKVKDLRNRNECRQHLLFLWKSWLPLRLSEYGIEPECVELRSFQAKVEGIIERYLDDVDLFLSSCTLCSTPLDYERVIFEGAQGLLLDEARLDQFPHVTRSRTGLTNVVELANQMKLDKLEVTYVSRTYLTRHGAGPLQNEAQWTIEDKTNIPNLFQGTLRFAPLDLAQLASSIELDLTMARFRFPNITANLAMTCADQMALPEMQNFPISLNYVASGPTRLTVKLIEKEFDTGSTRALASAAV